MEPYASPWPADEWDPAQTPIVSALIQMAAKDKVSLHVPGHKQGRLFPATLSAWMGSALQLDLTELPGLDNLHQPEGCIQQSEQLAATHYGAEETLYSVNGSSAAIIAAVMSLAGHRRILVAGSFHQSLWKGLILADARPVLIAPEFDPQRMEVIPPGPRAIADALLQHKDIAAVFVTSPTYNGRIADIEAIAQVVHEASLPLIVDEAHGAHLGLTGDIPAHSVSLGADVVIQSVHKVLPALTQTAWMHLQGPYIDRVRVRESLLMMQTTSPSYLLLASIDAAQAWLRLHGREVAASSLQTLQTYQRHTSQAWLSVPAAGATRQSQGFVRDPFRVWLPTGSHSASRALADALEQSGVMVEYADSLGVLLILSLDIQQRDLDRFMSVVRAKFVQSQGPAVPVRVHRGAPELLVSPREAAFASHEQVGLIHATGRVAGRMISPYPPGTPVVYPGQVIDKEMVACLLQLFKTGYPVVGIDRAEAIDVLRL